MELLKRYPISTVLAGSWLALGGLALIPDAGVLRFLGIPAYLTWLVAVVVSVGTSELVPAPVVLALGSFLVWFTDSRVVPLVRW